MFARKCYLVHEGVYRNLCNLKKLITGIFNKAILSQSIISRKIARFVGTLLDSRARKCRYYTPRYMFPQHAFPRQFLPFRYSHLYHTYILYICIFYISADILDVTEFLSMTLRNIWLRWSQLTCLTLSLSLFRIILIFI